MEIVELSCDKTKITLMLWRLAHRRSSEGNQPHLKSKVDFHDVDPRWIFCLEFHGRPRLWCRTCTLSSRCWRRTSGSLVGCWCCRCVVGKRFICEDIVKFLCCYANFWTLKYALSVFTFFHSYGRLKKLSMGTRKFLRLLGFLVFGNLEKFKQKRPSSKSTSTNESVLKQKWRFGGKNWQI